jgi:hypothetical protein
VSWKWTRLRAVLVSLGIIRSSEDDVKLLAGSHAAAIFGKRRGSEPHAGSPRITVVVFSAGARLQAGHPELHDDGLGAVRAEIAGLGIISVRHGATYMYACVCWTEQGRREHEGERESQPSFSPLGTTGANSMAFLFFH